MQDMVGSGRWIAASIIGVAGLIVALLTVQGLGTSAQEQPTPVPTSVSTPVPTPVATIAPTATPAPTPAEPGIAVNKMLSDLHNMAAGIASFDADQQQVVDLYQQAKGMALRAGVIIPFAVEANRFSNEGAFLAAKAAWEDALWNAQVTTADKQAVAFYARVLRNAGRNFASHGDTEDLRAKGRTLLVTCLQVVEKFKLPVGECSDDLREFLGDAPRPAPAPSPLL